MQINEKYLNTFSTVNILHNVVTKFLEFDKFYGKYLFLCIYSNIIFSYMYYDYVFQVLKESREERKKQLSELEKIFDYLLQNRSLNGFDGEKTAM